MKSDNKSKILLGIGGLVTAFIILSGPLFAQTIPLMLVEIFGALLILWAVLAIRANKNHLPKGIHHATTGPYEIIRHPVYAGLLLIMSSLVQENFTLLRLIAFAVLVIVVILRINKEERALEEHVKEYGEYKKKTHKLIPYLF